MNIETSTRDGVTVITVEGEIDGSTAPQAQEKLLPVIMEKKTVILDLSKVPFMSSAGLRMMLLLYRHATAGSGRVALAGLSEQIRDTMAATGFLDFFVVGTDAGEAARMLRT